MYKLEMEFKEKKTLLEENPTSERLYRVLHDAGLNPFVDGEKVVVTGKSNADMCRMFDALMKLKDKSWFTEGMASCFWHDIDEKNPANTETEDVLREIKEAKEEGLF